MPSLVRRCRLVLTAASCVSAIALPAAAFAVPVTVVTHSTGTASVHPTVLHALGQQETPPEDTLPYELTLTSTFDWTGPLPARGEGPYMVYDTEVVVDFRMGDLVYHAAGRDFSSASLYTPDPIGGDMYWHEVSMNPYPYAYGYSFNFEHTLHGPAGSMGPGGPLTAGTIDGSGDPYSYLWITAYYSNDEYTFSWTMPGDVATYDVRITSAVPEPAPFAMLAGGVLALGLWRGMKKGRRSALVLS